MVILGNSGVILGHSVIILGQPQVILGHSEVGLGNKWNFNTVEVKRRSGYLGNWRDGNWPLFTFENLFTNGFDKFWLHINFLGTGTGEVLGFL